jgi:RNA 2',3'-cyclic 3'-phosphodiesterase
MPDPARAPASRRLFFALWPDAALRAEAADRIAALVPAAGGRPQRPDQLHVTLVFLGLVPEHRLASVCSVGAGVTGAPVMVPLDSLEHWRKPQVLCLTASRVPPRLVALVEELRASLAAAELPSEIRTYRPHLTLARKVTRFDARAEVEPLLWRADSITLVESRSNAQGSSYEPLANWPLEAPKD